MEKKFLNEKRIKSDNNDDLLRFKKKVRYPNRKREIKQKLEFYLSDENLIHDKFLTNILKREGNGVKLETFLDFNKIRLFLNEIKDIEEKKKMLIKACENSDKIYYSPKDKKIYRKKQYDINSINLDFLDNCTVYIENLPPNTTHDVLFEIFKKYKIKYISLPKYKKSGQCKGFSFITFNSIENAEEVIKNFNKSLPNELYKINVKENNFLKIISKKEWLEQKKNFKEFKLSLQKINQKNFINCSDGNEYIENEEKLMKGTLLKLCFFDTKIKLKDIKILVNNFIKPIFIDYNNETGVAILRFASPLLANEFLKVFNEKNKLIELIDKESVTCEKVLGNEEDEYLEKVKKLMDDFQKKKKEKNLTKTIKKKSIKKNKK